MTLPSPTSGEVTDNNVTIAGVVADATTGVATLDAEVDSGPVVPVTFSPSGAFQFSTSLAIDGSANGSHTVHFVATDRAGNASSSVDFPFTLMAAHGLLDGLTGVNVTQVGGTGSGQGGVTADGFSVVFHEGNSFLVSLEKTITIPAQPSVLTFSYANLDYDDSEPSTIHDAFEAALVDSSGNPLVHTIGSNHDSYFNITQGQPVASGVGTTVAGQDVTVDLAGLTPGSQATLIFRLVNNDGPGTSSVELTRIALLSGGPTTPDLAPAAVAAAPASPLDVSTLSDVSASTQGLYGQTSFDAGTQVLHAALSILDSGQYSIFAPLAVGISGISDPNVRLLNFDGTTPRGIPYLNYSGEVAGQGLRLRELDGVTGASTS